MKRYIFIESRDPFESRDTQFVEDTAVAVKERGHEVTVFLVQNGVLAARNSVGRLARLAEAGVKMLADDFHCVNVASAPRSSHPGFASRESTRW